MGALGAAEGHWRATGWSGRAAAQAHWRAAMRLGWDVERLSAWRVPETLKTISEPVLCIEALFGPSIAEQLGVGLLEPPLDWLPGLREEYRRRWIHLTSLGQARRLPAPAFIGPPNDKSFPARVYAPGALPTDLPDTTSVPVSEVVPWQVEFRCFVLDRALRTSSVYAREGKLMTVKVCKMASVYGPDARPPRSKVVPRGLTTLMRPKCVRLWRPNADEPCEEGKPAWLSSFSE